MCFLDFRFHKNLEVVAMTVILAQIGLKDLHFFSVEGTGLGPEILEKSRLHADEALQAYFPLRTQSI